MASSFEALQLDIEHLKQDMDFIKHLLAEDHELSDRAQKALDKARETPESEYIELE